MKMYILVCDDIPLGYAMVAVAHTSLAGYLRFQDEPEVREWLSGPFFKAVCKVNAKEFENTKQVADHGADRVGARRPGGRHRRHQSIYARSATLYEHQRWAREFAELTDATDGVRNAG